MKNRKYEFLYEDLRASGSIQLNNSRATASRAKNFTKGGLSKGLSFSEGPRTPRWDRQNRNLKD